MEDGGWRMAIVHPPSSILHPLACGGRTMPIPLTDLTRQFIVAAPDATIGAVLVQLPADRYTRAFTYVVLPVAGARYIVVRWIEVEEIARAMDEEVRGLRLATLDGLPRAVEGV